MFPSKLLPRLQNRSFNFRKIAEVFVCIDRLRETINDFFDLKTLYIPYLRYLILYLNTIGIHTG